MAEFFRFTARPPGNVWLGVTVENRADGVPRLDALRLITLPLFVLSPQNRCWRIWVRSIWTGGGLGHRRRRIRTEKTQADETRVGC